MHYFVFTLKPTDTESRYIGGRGYLDMRTTDFSRAMRRYYELKIQGQKAHVCGRIWNDWMPDTAEDFPKIVRAARGEYGQ